VSLIDPHVSSVVDFGCGDGRLTKALLQRPEAPGHRLSRIYLVDKFSEMLALTEDIECPSAAILRVCDDELLARLPGDAVGTIDLIACNSSIFLLRDVDAFVQHAGAILRNGGQLVANIPDQDYRFDDGWRSRFKEQADALWPFPDRGPNARFSNEYLRVLAAKSDLAARIDVLTCMVTWADFVRFYSIPFMGARRMPGMNQDERVRMLQQQPPLFEEIPYRWVHVVLTKRGH
jgi:SAM-dependent methyltransferase